METGRPSTSRAVRLGMLIAVFGTLVAGLILRDHARSVPYEPELYLLNDSMMPLKDFVIRSECGDVPLGSLAEDQRVRLTLRPRPGCRYLVRDETILGDDLLRLLEMGRDQRADVVIEVGLDYVRAEFR